MRNHTSRGSESARITDEELMLRVREGEPMKLGELFERHHARLYRFCLRMTANPALSEDLVQDVFARMLRYRRTFRPNSRFLPWMYRMARNVTHDHFRRSSREEPAADTPETRRDDAPLADQRLVEDEAVGLLRDALQRLPADKREVLVLSRFQSRKYQEIAELLDCSEGAIKVRVHRAIKQLRDIYAEILEQRASGDPSIPAEITP